MTPALIAPPHERPKCPVCGKISYSREGIHPQCAVHRADAKLRLIEKAKRDAEAAAVQAAGLNQLPGTSQLSHPLTGAPPMQEIPDRSIDQQVSQKLSSRGINSPCQVSVNTRRGEVTLSGLVQHPHQKNAAVQAANSVTGVKRVIDNLTIKPVVRY